MYYGWYSAKQAKLGGVTRWETPFGTVVEVSTVSKTQNNECEWDDMIPVGEVTKFVERISDGEYGNLDNCSLEECCRRMAIITGKPLKGMEKVTKAKTKQELN